MWGNLKTSLRWWNSGEIDRLKRTTKSVVFLNWIDNWIFMLSFYATSIFKVIAQLQDMIWLRLFCFKGTCNRYPLLRLSNLPPERSSYKLDVDGIHYMKNWIELMHNQIKCFTEKAEENLWQRSKTCIVFSHMGNIPNPGRECIWMASGRNSIWVTLWKRKGQVNNIFVRWMGLDIWSHWIPPFVPLIMSRPQNPHLSTGRMPGVLLPDTLTACALQCKIIIIIFILSDVFVIKFVRSEWNLNLQLDWV